jgi:hypothetical protein
MAQCQHLRAYLTGMSIGVLIGALVFTGAGCIP